MDDRVSKLVVVLPIVAFSWSCCQLNVILFPFHLLYCSHLIECFNNSIEVSPCETIFVLSNVKITIHVILTL